MALVGDYDASTFVDGDYGTYPQLPAGVATYQPTMWWRVSVDGTVQGQAVIVGDLLFATLGVGRLYGDGGYGEGVYGGLTDVDWAVEQVYFLHWDSTLPPPDMVPYPNAGCAFTREDLPDGDWAPGWRIVVDAYYDAAVGTRTYGEDLYGDDLYGDVASVASGPRWVDITQPSFRIETGDGNVDGSPRVPVAEVVVTLLDDTGVWFDMAEPATWHQPQPGTPLRVGLIDPTFAYHPVVTAEIERIEDVHDYETGGRTVMVRGFGRIMDLTVDVPNVQRPAEQASTRFNALSSLAGWRWDAGSVVFPGDDAPLLADDAPHTITVRDELDRTVRSAGWFLDTDRRGRMRVRRWPHEPDGDPLVVVDCVVPPTWIPGYPGALVEDPVDSDLYELVGVGMTEDPGGSGLYEIDGMLIEDPPATYLFDLPDDEAVMIAGTPEGALVSPQIVFANDMSRILNRVVTTNTATPTAGEVVVEDVVAQRRGVLGRAFGFPLTGLAWSSVTATTAWARRVLNRFANISRQVEMFSADTFVDQAWLPALAELDTGQAVSVQRQGISLLELDAVVVGWRHVIEPGRWQSTVFTSTTTSSL